MVVFTCGHCGESVQKPKVEKHYLTKCRNKNPNLSCMDCFKDFLGQDYESHTKCVTEEERYSGKGFTAKEKKGEKKQNAWVEMLQSVLDEEHGAPKNVLRIVEAISKHTNTPRKKPKFINFVKNVCGHKTNPADIDQAWALISVKLAALSTATQNGKTTNVSVTNGEKNLNGTSNHDNETSENGTESTEEDKKVENGVQNGGNESKNEVTEEQNQENEKENVSVDNKKLTKKQRKEEKKRQKYEAELQSAAVPLEEVVEEETEVKKGKKKKNKTELTNGTNGNVEENGESKKQKKRKRLDTVNSVNGVQETEVASNVENEVVVKEKTKKKKQKVDSIEKTEKSDKAEESLCLHDQNVAIIEEAGEQCNGKFNWHAVIMSVLQKKGNEVPFKRLQKKVLSEYSEATGQEVDDRIAEKFIKKLKSAPNVRVDKNRVLLVE